MQIVIDIPEEMHKAIEQGCFGIKYSVYDIIGRVMEGQILPEHRGRLIDADEMAMIITARFFNNIHYGAILKALWDSTTIIEAEKGDKE